MPLPQAGSKQGLGWIGRRDDEISLLEGTISDIADRSAPLEPASACPITPVLDLVFSRWTTPVLWALNEYGRQRFSELQRNIALITPKVLTQRLRQMERDGLIVRTYHREVPPRVEYEISDLGRSLAPLFQMLSQWSSSHLPEVEQARRRYDTLPAPLPVRG